MDFNLEDKYLILTKSYERKQKGVFFSEYSVWPVFNNALNDSSSLSSGLLA